MATKQPDEALTFTYDFSADLGTDTIASINSITVQPDDGSLVKAAQSFTPTAVLVRWQGGTNGASYLTKVSVLTTNGDTIDQNGSITVMDFANPPAAAPGIAPFNYAIWAARYPELAPKVPFDLANAYFQEAGIYLNNTNVSIVSNIPTRQMLLNMLVAHISALNIARADPSFFAAGRISSATEGSVSISLDLAALPGRAAWYAQTTYGLSYWAATAQFRTAQYRPMAPRYFGPAAGVRGLWR